jgi:WhiB family redox-sensing transcriptional regulator
MQFKGTSVSTAEPVTNWRRRSSCLQVDPKLFFGPDDETVAVRQVREAVASTVCRACPVLAQCLVWSLDTAIPYGVWGGLGEDERAEILARDSDKLQGQESCDLVEVAS